MIAKRLLPAIAIWGLLAPWAAQAMGAAFSGSTTAQLREAVVRIVSPDQVGVSYGSGVLVAVRGNCGLVLTNWHVIREAAGPVQVIFPDGFRSAATVLDADADWDLAALAIWRPRAQPVPIASQPPRPGELLTIAGYGRGWYREASGMCTQYLSPGASLPFELVELAAPARQGDSGGPIFNQRGELAGVLFGSAFGRTTGSHSGRVRWFLDRVWPRFRRLTDQQPMFAQSRSELQVPPASIGTSNAPGAVSAREPCGLRCAIQAVRPRNPAPIDPGVRPAAADCSAMPSVRQRVVPAEQPAGAASEPQSGQAHPASAAEARPAIPAPESTSGESSTAGALISSSRPGAAVLGTRWEQFKTALAIFGGAVLLLNAFRLLGRAVG